MIEEPLAIWKLLSKKKLEKALDQIDPLAIVTLSGQLSPDDPGVFQLKKIKDVHEAHPLFDGHRAKLLESVCHVSQLFGPMKLDRQVNHYEGAGVWCGEAVSVTFCVEESAELKGLEKIAKKLWGNQKKWSQTIKAYATKKLRHVLNDCWLEDGEKLYSKKKFCKKLSLRTISLDIRGFTFWFDDGDMFLGHSVYVTGTLKKGPQFASI
ncbi:MAG: DUF2262 domain-containing protein [Planctomycetota bacterium]|nr:DUF2262 domain-containing protein [Planctomycetota bacterium]